MKKRQRRKISLSRKIKPVEGEYFKDMPDTYRPGNPPTKRVITVPIVRTGRDDRDIIPTTKIKL